MAHATSRPGYAEVSAKKSEMKEEQAKRLKEVSVRDEERGFTVSETYESKGEMGNSSSKRFAFSTEAEAMKHLLACVKKFGDVKKADRTE